MRARLYRNPDSQKNFSKKVIPSRIILAGFQWFNLFIYDFVSDNIWLLGSIDNSEDSINSSEVAASMYFF